VNLYQALGVRQSDIVAFVGGGGKTSAMLRLARELRELGLRVLSTTTTRIASREIDRSISQLALGGAQLPPPALADMLQANRHVFIYQKLKADDKLQGLRAEWFDQHIAPTSWMDVTLIEADGARQLPLKGPYSHEPVIPATATLVVPVVGMNALGLPLDPDHIYGADMIAATTGHAEGAPVTQSLIAEVLVHPWLGLKGVPESARVVPLLNQVQSEDTYVAASVIARRALQRRSIHRVAVGAVQDERGPVWEVHRRIGAVVLAAGLSTRMQRPKLLLPWGETTIIAHVCRTLTEIGLDTTVVTGHQSQAIADALAGLPVNLTRNPDYAAGEMLSSLQVGLAQLETRGAEGCLVVLGDQPTLQSEVIHMLLQAYREGRGGIIAPSYRQQRGHPILIDRRYWPEIHNLPPGSAPRDVIRAHEDDVFHLVVDTPSVLRDLDTPEDYQQALRDFDTGNQ
jgi:molybdenum cofactor cytidylyltransferase